MKNNKKRNNISKKYYVLENVFNITTYHFKIS